MPFDNRSRFIDPASDEELHHDLFVDVLRSALQPHGTKREVAARSGYSETYLYLILEKQRNIPSAEALESIVRAIPDITTRQAQALRRYARVASGVRRSATRGLRLVIDDAQVAAELERLEAESHEATHAPTPEVTKRGLLEVRTGASRLAMGIRDPVADPQAYVRVCLLLNHVQSLLDDHADALKWARFARAVVEEAEGRTRLDGAAPHRPDLHVAVLLAEALAFHNLNADRQALRRYDLAARHLAGRSSDPRQTHIAMGRIYALIGMRRFRIGDVKTLVEAIERQCAAGVHAEAQATLLAWRAQRGLAEAYVRHGDLKPRTERVLTDVHGRLERLALAGPIHKVQLYRTFAGFYLARGDRAGQEHFAMLGLRTAEAAGLAHQARRFDAVVRGLPVGHDAWRLIPV